MKPYRIWMWKGERNIQTFYVPSTSLERSRTMFLRTCAITWTTFWNEKLRTTGSGNNLIRLKAHKSCSRKYISCATFAIDVEEEKGEESPKSFEVVFPPISCVSLCCSFQRLVHSLSKNGLLKDWWWTQNFGFISTYRKQQLPYQTYQYFNQV